MTPLYHSRPERWPQVSLKGVFVLATVLGVALGWLGVQVKWIRDRHEAIKWIHEHSDEASYIKWGWIDEAHNTLTTVGGIGMNPNEGPAAGLPTTPPWAVRVFGSAADQAGVTEIYLWTDRLSSSQEKRAELQKLFPEAYVSARPFP